MINVLSKFFIYIWPNVLRLGAVADLASLIFNPEHSAFLITKLMRGKTFN